jgi:glutamate:GABA antiporter
MWLVGAVGFLGSLLALILSFIPPGQIKVGSPALYVGILIVLSAAWIAVPFVIYAVRKPHWRDPDNDFAPFTLGSRGRPPRYSHGVGNRDR